MCLIRKVSDLLNSLKWCMKSCDPLHWNISTYVVMIDIVSIQTVQKEHLEENVKCFVSATNYNCKKSDNLKYLIASNLLAIAYISVSHALVSLFTICNRSCWSKSIPLIVNCYPLQLAQGIIIIIMNRNGKFCKGTWVSKIIAETKVDARIEQKIHWFFSYVCNGKFAMFWVLYCEITCEWVLFLHRSLEII